MVASCSVNILSQCVYALNYSLLQQLRDSALQMATL